MPKQESVKMNKAVMIVTGAGLNAIAPEAIIMARFAPR